MTKLSYLEALGALGMTRPDEADYVQCTPSFILAQLGSALRNAGLELVGWPQPFPVIRCTVVDPATEFEQMMAVAHGLYPAVLTCTACSWSERFTCGQAHSEVHADEHIEACPEFIRQRAEAGR